MENVLIKEDFEKNGFTIIRDVFSKVEVDKFRNFVKEKSIETLGDYNSNYKNLLISNQKDVLSYPELSPAILNQKLIQSLKILLDGNPSYWGYSSFRWNEKVNRSFHNDAKNDKNCPFSTKYPLLRIGIYLQNHSEFSNGLKIWKGSCHALRYGRTMLKKIFFKNGSLKYLVPQQLFKSINVDTTAGDVVVWNLRTCHSGGALRIKPFPKTSFQPVIENFMEKRFPKLCLPAEKNRAVIFATFGKESVELTNFIEDNKKHPELKNTFKNSNFLDEDIVSTAKKLGLNILDIKKDEKNYR